MIKITNGKQVFEVTTGAYKSIYKKQGYYPVDEQEMPEEAPVKVLDNKPSADEQFVADIKEKPLSQWSKDEVKRFAALNKIDISGTKNANEAKEIIKGFLEQ